MKTRTIINNLHLTFWRNSNNSKSNSKKEIEPKNEYKFEIIENNTYFGEGKYHTKTDKQFLEKN
jgi:hypothetical protein